MEIDKLFPLEAKGNTQWAKSPKKRSEEVRFC